MRLNVGERLEGAGPEHQPGGYVVTSVVRETPWYGLYIGKKIFYNFDFSAKRVRETDDVEWLDVFLRTIRYPVLDDPGYVQQRRALARAEVRAVLGNRHSNLWPEPLDLLEIENTRDPFTFADTPTRAGEPVIVFTRPHGQFTTDWQQQILPISSILSVLAELLEFLAQAHEEGLLLLGLGPNSLLIDASDRVHYIGSEMVLSRQSSFLKESTSPAAWQRLFPADRFARGYSAPECFDPAKRPDTRSDLYAWGSLAYGLLTGTDLSKIAQEQGRPWTTLTESHWTQFENVLGQLPTNSLHTWAAQVGMEPQTLLEDWPRKFVTVFRMLLSPEPVRRPRSVAELLAWLADPPPSPVASFIAIHTDVDAARLLLDCTGVEPELEMTIQCERDNPPLLPTDGMTVAQGAVRPVVAITYLPLTKAPMYYTVFTRRKHEGVYVYSPGVCTQLWQVEAKSLLRWVEQEALTAFDAHHLPTRVGMVLGALDTPMVVDSLLASPVSRVRAWALRRVEQWLGAQGHTDSLEMLLWRFLADAQVELRQSAALLLWTYHPTKTDEVLLRIVDALEKPPLDVAMPLMHFLRQLQLPEGRIRQVTQYLESRRPTECPLCQKPLTLSERAMHLQSEHGFLLYDGDLLPADVVYSRMWERIFHQQDRQAHEELVNLYLGAPSVKNSPVAAAVQYLRGLHRMLLGGSVLGGEQTIPLALPYDSILAYQNTLRLSKLFMPVSRQLLRSGQKRLHDLGCHTVLPYLQEKLLEHAKVTELRRLLTLFCPDLEQTDLQIELCQQLSQLDVDQSVIRTCIAQLEEERLVVCSECKAEVRSRELEFHLRRAHQIFQFRGQRGTYQEVRSAMAKAVCGMPQDTAAWQSLYSLAEDRHAKEADRYLVAWLYQHIKDIETEERNTAIRSLTDVMVSAEAAKRLLPIFVGPCKNTTWELLGQRIALEICSRLPPPLPTEWIAHLKPFLDQKELPRRSRENAVLGLLRSVERNSPVALEMLRAYIAHTGKKRGLEKLQQLEQRFGQSPAIARLSQECEDEIRMSCPRCPTELRKKDMVGHLWDKHRLVLDGQRVREPWRLIEDWVVDYGLEKDGQVLQRCKELALRDDPQMGLARLQLSLYRRGLRDRELLNELRAQVRSRKATLCPHCCALVPVEETAVVKPLAVDATSLEGYGYSMEVLENGMVPSLEIESPTTIVYQGREPGRGLTRIGAVLLLCGPLIAVTYGIVDWSTNREFPALSVWSLAFGFGLLAAGILYLIWPNPRPIKERLARAAWKLLVPEMLEEEMTRRAWNFLNGLAELSKVLPASALSRDLLLECCEQASKAAVTDSAARACLSSLSRRYLASLRMRGNEPYEYVLNLAEQCFKGNLPLTLLSDLLENFDGNERTAWARSDLHRLPILLADLAFRTEVEIDDWLNLGRAFPVLNTVLNLEQRWHWLQFHTLWRQREERPWDKVGQVVSVLELVEESKIYDELLAYYPDVLLYVESANLTVGSKGVWIEGVCITSYQPGQEISAQRVSGGYELLVGYQQIRCSENPRPYLEEIRSWLHYYFVTFLPKVPGATSLLTESRHRMWQLNKISCAECERPLVPCLGDLGVTVR